MRKVVVKQFHVLPQKGRVEEELQAMRRGETVRKTMRLSSLSPLGMSHSTVRREKRSDIFHVMFSALFLAGTEEPFTIHATSR